MKKALPNTKVTVNLRGSNYKEEWYLIIESYPVYKRGSTRASRVVESINRTISQNTASTYFSILKADLKQAFIDEYLTVDISAKVKGITNIKKSRVALTMNEVQMLVDTPCKDDVLKRAFLFSILTGLRHSDIQTLKWKQIQQTSKGTWQAVVIQQKTKVPDYKPVIQQSLQLCGERPSNDETLVFEGLTDAFWISRPLKVWIEASGIKKHITFHCVRHSFASLLLENGIDIYHHQVFDGTYKCQNHADLYAYCK